VRITRNEKITYDAVTLDKIQCNHCERKIDFTNNENYYDGHYEGGFGSLLGDSDKYEFDLCEICLKAMFTLFKIPVTVNGQ